MGPPALVHFLKSVQALQGLADTASACFSVSAIAEVETTFTHNCGSLELVQSVSLGCLHMAECGSAGRVAREQTSNTGSSLVKRKGTKGSL